MVSSVYSAKGGGTKHLQSAAKLFLILPSITPFSCKDETPQLGVFQRHGNFYTMRTILCQEKKRDKESIVELAINMPM
jgi:hypothetical protein